MSITMSDLNNRVATLEGKSSTTPITMSDLKNRIEALEARPVKDWLKQSLRYSKSDMPGGYARYIFTIPSGWGSVNYMIEWMGGGFDRNKYEITKDSSYIYIKAKFGNMTPPQNITVLFYK